MIPKLFLPLQMITGNMTSAEAAGVTFVGKTLALAIIQNVQKLAGGKNTI